MFCTKCGQSLPEDSVFCQFCGTDLSNIEKPSPTNIAPQTTAKRFKWSKLAYLFIALLLCLNAYQFTVNNTLSDEIDYHNKLLQQKNSTISTLIDQRNDYKNKYESANDKAQFMDNHVVIVSNDGTNLYHRYGCDKLDLTSFWAYNSEAAISKGYKACPNCTKTLKLSEQLRQKLLGE